MNACFDAVNCLTNAVVKHFLEFTLNTILFKIFCALPKDAIHSICQYFGVDPVEELITGLQSIFFLRFVRQKAMCVERFPGYGSRV